MTYDQIISDQEIENYHFWHGNCPQSKRDVVNHGALQIAIGYMPGSTVKAILASHSLIDYNDNLTVKGREYLWAVYSTPPKVDGGGE